MSQNGHWKKLPAAAFLVPAGEAIAAIQALAFQLLTALTATRPVPTASLVSAQHFMQTES